MTFNPELRAVVHIRFKMWIQNERLSERSVHKVLLLVLPGADMVMLAQRLTTILPAMPLAAAIETTRINRVADLTGGRTAFVTRHPCGAPAISNMLEVNHAKVKRALSQI